MSVSIVGSLGHESVNIKYLLKKTSELQLLLKFPWTRLPFSYVLTLDAFFSPFRTELKCHFHSTSSPCLHLSHSKNWQVPFQCSNCILGIPLVKHSLYCNFNWKMCKIINFFLPVSGRYFAHHCILMSCSIKTFGRAGFIQAAIPDVNLPC